MSRGKGTIVLLGALLVISAFGESDKPTQVVTAYDQPILFFDESFQPISFGELPEGIESWSFRACVECHKGACEEWAKSAHAASTTDPMFVAVFNDSPRAVCRTCHSPLPQQHPVMVKLTSPLSAMKGQHAPMSHRFEVNEQYDADLAAEGITCATCHIRDGTVLTARKQKTTTAPHPLAFSKDLGTSEFCARCHQFNVLEDRNVHPFEPIDRMGKLVPNPKFDPGEPIPPDIIRRVAASSYYLPPAISEQLLSRRERIDALKEELQRQWLLSLTPEQRQKVMANLSGFPFRVPPAARRSKRAPAGADEAGKSESGTSPLRIASPSATGNTHSSSSQPTVLDGLSISASELYAQNLDAHFEELALKLVDRVKRTPVRFQNTYSEFLSANLPSGASCNTCHMRSENGRVSHLCAGANDLKMLQSAVELVMPHEQPRVRGEPMHLVVSLKAKELGHNMPTGDALHGVELVLTLYGDGKPLAENRWMLRRTLKGIIRLMGGSGEPLAFFDEADLVDEPMARPQLPTEYWQPPLRPAETRHFQFAAERFAKPLHRVRRAVLEAQLIWHTMRPEFFGTAIDPRIPLSRLVWSKATDFDPRQVEW